MSFKTSIVGLPSLSISKFLNPDLAGVKHEVDQLLVSGRDNTDVGDLGGIYGAGDQTVQL